MPGIGQSLGTAHLTQRDAASPQRGEGRVLPRPYGIGGPDGRAPLFQQHRHMVVLQHPIGQHLCFLIQAPGGSEGVLPRRDAHDEFFTGRLEAIRTFL